MRKKIERFREISYKSAKGSISVSGLPLSFCHRQQTVNYTKFFSKPTSKLREKPIKIIVSLAEQTSSI